MRSPTSIVAPVAAAPGPVALWRVRARRADDETERLGLVDSLVCCGYTGPKLVRIPDRG
jgi:hypothetical protein